VEVESMSRRLFPHILEVPIGLVLASLPFLPSALELSLSESNAVLFIWLIAWLIVMALDWVSGTITLVTWLTLYGAVAYKVLTYTQVVAILVVAIIMYAGILISIPLLRAREERKTEEKPETPQRPLRPKQSLDIHNVGEAQKPTSQTVKPASAYLPKTKKTIASEKARVKTRLGLSEVGVYSPSGLYTFKIGPLHPSAYLPDYIDAYMKLSPKGGLRLTVMDGYAVLSSKDIGAEYIIDAIRSLLPSSDTHFAYEYHVDEGEAWKAIATALQGRTSVVRVRREKKDRVGFPLKVKWMKIMDYIHYKYPSTIPEELHLLLYGSALHEAVEALVRTKSLTDAFEAYKRAIVGNRMYGVLYREDTVESESGERPAPPLGELYKAGVKALQLFSETEIYKEYGLRYTIPELRAILIGDSIAVYAKPDYKSMDDRTIYDIKTVDLASSPSETFNKVREQMRVFQLAYPGSKAVVLCMPYNCDRISIFEFEPLTYSDIRSLLPELERVCMEVGKEEVVGTGLTILRYLQEGAGIRFEVWKPLKVPLSEGA
jgi:hypothetical protein